MTLRLAFALCLMLPVLAAASGGDGYTVDPYVPASHVPAPEVEAFAGGKLGVVDGDYFRVFHVLAWRALHGAVLSPAEVKGLHLNEWRVGDKGEGDDGVETWLKARAAIAPSAPAAGPFGVELSGPNYGSYVNCTPDAFRRAAATAHDRAARHGAAEVAEWLAGQDAVFANCSSQMTRSGSGWTRPEPVLPPPARADAPAWLQADRAYQTAAALFYAGQHAQARVRFLAIGADRSSPWQPLGAYLAARCLLRQATLAADATPQATADAQRLLVQARAELAALAAHDPAALRLLGWVDVRVRPAERAAELAQQLQASSLAGAARVALLNDYLRLLDNAADVERIAWSAQPMTAWIGLMQSSARVDLDEPLRPPLRDLARRHWRKDGDPAWLMPLAAQARRLDELDADDLKAMREVPASSAAWQTINWHLARLELVAAHAAQADVAIDAALADTTLAPSTRNRWLRLKLASARTIEAMLAAAPRQRAERDDLASVPIPDEGKPMPLATGVDEDFTRRLYRHLPLTQLDSLVGRPDFPADLRTAHVEIVFTRALLLEDWAIADRLAPEVARPRTTTQSLYRRLLAAATPADKKLAAALILVNTPELNPAPIGSGGDLRYWGCGSDRAGTGAALDPMLQVPPRFLSDVERAAAERERAVLAKLPVRTRWLADGLLKWAATKPDDPEAPKALHLLVMSTRMECLGGDAKPGQSTHSRQAFNLLHALWPRSEWAAKTKYWF